MKIQDVITYEPKIFKIIYDEKTSELVGDRNYFTMIRALRAKPRTPEELVEIYESVGIPKSLMTIYRYIRILTKAGIITEAGKRIITDEENRNRTETLFTTTSRLLYDECIKKDLDNERSIIRKKEVEVYSMLIELVMKEKVTDILKVNHVIDLVYTKGLEKLTEIIKVSEKDLHKYLADFGMMMTNTLIVHIGWLSLILEDDIKDEILNCLK